MEQTELAVARDYALRMAGRLHRLSGLSEMKHKKELLQEDLEEADRQEAARIRLKLQRVNERWNLPHFRAFRALIADAMCACSRAGGPEGDERLEARAVREIGIRLERECKKLDRRGR